MKKHGWLKEFPALIADDGFVLVGTRRLKIASELGIKPVIKTVVIGTGTEADVKRLRKALLSVGVLL
jgi:hypothetical protein